MGRVNSKIPKSLLTTVGDIIGASAVGTPARIAAPALGQVFTGQGAGVLPVWAVSAVTRAGGNTVEATTTSITAVDLLTATGLNIATNLPVRLMVAGRKTTGAASFARLGLKVNATITQEANPDFYSTSSTNQVESGYVDAVLGSRLADYLRAAIGIATGASLTAVAVGVNPDGTAALPNAAITDIIIRAQVGDAAITEGADELHVYTYAAS